MLKVPRTSDYSIFADAASINKGRILKVYQSSQKESFTPPPPPAAPPRANQLGYKISNPAAPPRESVGL